MTELISTFSWNGLAGGLLKLTGLLLLALGAMSLFHRAEPRWRVGIARTALILIPLLLAAHFWAPRWEVTVQTKNMPPDFVAVPMVLNESAPVLPLEAPVSQFNWVPILLSAWLVVAFLLMVSEAAYLVRLAGRIRRGRAPSEHLSQLWREIVSQHRLRDASLRVISENESPLIQPDFVPVVAVPRSFESIDASNLERVAHALRHEAAHLQSNDQWWIPGMRLMACLFWFHPLAWWLASAHLRACEEAADAAAAREGGIEDYRQALAQLALELLPTNQPATATLLRAPSVLKRLNQVDSNGRLRPPKWWITAPVLAVLVVLGLTLGIFQLATAAERGDAADVEEEVVQNETQEKLARIIVPAIELQDTPFQDAIDFLRQKSVELDSVEADPARKGVNIIVRGDETIRKKRITLKLSSAPLGVVLQYCGELVGLKYVAEEHAVLFQKQGEPVDEEMADEVKSLEDKLKRIVVPEIEFQDTPVADAIEFLHVKARELDSVEADPARKGINVVIKADPGDAKVTLKLTNVPLSEALRYTCTLAGLVYEVHPYAVVISKAKP